MLGVVQAVVNLLTSLGFKPDDLQRLIASPWWWVLGVASALIGWLFSLYKVTPLEIVIYLGRAVAMLLARLRGRSTVILYVDIEEQKHVSRNIAADLGKHPAIAGWHRFVTIASGDGIIRTPLAPWLVRAVVLIVTDVTKLSNEAKRRELIQSRLERFCHGGGVLVVSHDVLYRRCRNGRLQDLAGGRITGFVAIPSPGLVDYVRCTAGDRCSVVPFGEGTLPPAFSLGDKEVVHGTWQDDVDFLYVWKDRPEVPLVTRRRVAAGSVFFLNSGDTDAAGSPKSVSQPSPQLVALLATMIAEG